MREGLFYYPSKNLFKVNSIYLSLVGPRLGMGKLALFNVKLLIGGTKISLLSFKADAGNN